MKRGVVAAVAAWVSALAFSSASVAADPPQFQVDPFWPKPLPSNWLLGQVASVAVGPEVDNGKGVQKFKPDRTP